MRLREKRFASTKHRDYIQQANADPDNMFLFPIPDANQSTTLDQCSCAGLMKALRESPGQVNMLQSEGRNLFSMMSGSAKEKDNSDFISVLLTSFDREPIHKKLASDEVSLLLMR